MFAPVWIFLGVVFAILGIALAIALVLLPFWLGMQAWESVTMNWDEHRAKKNREALRKKLEENRLLAKQIQDEKNELIDRR
jgi:hypothetical protein